MPRRIVFENADEAWKKRRKATRSAWKKKSSHKGLRRRNPTFYKTFKRSATSFDSMVNARKITVDTGLTEAQARAQCQEFNNNRTPAQIRKGLKMEYTAQ